MPSRVFDLTATFDANVSDSMTLSGSFTSQLATSQGIYEVSGTIESILDDLTQTQGTWFGTALNYGMLEITTDAEWTSGSWLGADSTWGTNGAPLENHDTTLLFSDDNPRVVEGINLGEYNPFPYPETPPEEPQRLRDATRFQKAYSFSRHQPVRIRVYKR